MRFKKIFGSIPQHLFFVVSIVSFLLVFISFIVTHPSFVERIYSRKVYPLITDYISSVTTIVSFSLSELSLYLSISFVCFTLWQGFYRHRLKKNLILILEISVVLLILFYSVWGLNYFRQPLEKQLGLPAGEAEHSRLNFARHFLWITEMTNANWQIVTPWELSALDHKIEVSYEHVLKEFNLDPIPGRRCPKFLYIPALFNYTLTSGMFGPFFHEIHLNSDLLPIELPFVLAHEKAHQMGYARESEANFWAALVCIKSSDPGIQYSGYFSLLSRFWNHADLVSGSDSLRYHIRSEILDDFKAVRKRYSQYIGTISDLAQDSYDIYLRANQVEGGIKNYSDVVWLIIRWREKNDLIFKE